MPITYTIDKQDRLVRIVGTGRLTDEELTQWSFETWQRLTSGWAPSRRSHFDPKRKRPVRIPVSA